MGLGGIAAWLGVVIQILFADPPLGADNALMMVALKVAKPRADGGMGRRFVVARGDLWSAATAIVRRRRGHQSRQGRRAAAALLRISLLGGRN